MGLVRDDCLSQPIPMTRNAASRQTALNILADGFFDDPVMSWLFPDEAKRSETLKGWFAFWTDIFGDLARLEVDASGDGATLWAIPHPPPPPPEAFAPVVEFVAAHHGDATGSILASFGQMNPPETEHWYLNAIAARRGQRARGIGALMLQPVLKEADEAGIPAYLESSNPRNLSFYRRFGFEDFGDRIELGAEGPYMQRMLRPVGG